MSLPARPALTPPPATLLILAAGMGSRYGGLKQLDPVGPAGETLLDYSVYDALRAGFSRVVFVIRREFAEEFEARIGQRYAERVEVAYVYQGLDVLPEGCRLDVERQKPLGTGHAIWCAREAITTPFAAINADDFYGAEAYAVLMQFFARVTAGANAQSAEAAVKTGTEVAASVASASAHATPVTYAMVGYRLDRTLSEHGLVSRGVCTVDAEGYLQAVEERGGLAKTPTGACCPSRDGGVLEFSGAETVSMNCWGFTPEIFPQLEAGLRQFLDLRGQDPTAEFYIPTAVADLIQTRAARVEVLTSASAWFGVTYRADKPLVAAALAALTADGHYR